VCLRYPDRSVGIVRVLGAGAGPEQALWASAFLAQFVELLTSEEIDEMPIGDPSISDGDLAFQGVRLWCVQIGQCLVHATVHSADKETGDRGNLVNGFTLRRPRSAPQRR